MFLRGRPVTMYMPKDQVESYNLEAKAELPAKRLKLEWVYPFLCYRNTLHRKLLIASSIILKNVAPMMTKPNRHLDFRN